METVQHSQGPLPFEIPADATTTEITPYLWPGHYGEWDEAAQSFTAWALISPSAWRVTSEILAPPVSCLSVGATVTRLRFRSCDLPNALQEFHVECRQSSQLSDLCLIDQSGMAPGSLQTTHPEPLLTKTHPEPLLTKIHPAPLLKTHPAPVQTKAKALAQAQAPTKGQLAVWRIHTKIHTARP